jgi:hypothetical protein
MLLLLKNFLLKPNLMSLKPTIYEDYIFYLDEL